MPSQFRKIKSFIPVIYLIFATLWLRLINLGYSNYQGDEIKALYRPKLNQELWDFLLSQRKGPIQFLVTYLMGIFNPTYDNELYIRLPFAIAGILAVYIFYKLIKLEYGQEIAVYSSLFLSINGFFVAFSRIVQYQSFVILFSVLALYLFSLSGKFAKWRVSGLYLGVCCWVIAILAHYDGLFITPYALYLLYRWFKNYSVNNSYRIQHLIIVTVLFLLSLSIFYLPFFLSVSESTKEYWTKRISKKSVSSIKTFMTYNTSYVFYIYAILGLCSLPKIKQVYAVLAWFLFSFLSLEILVKNPGTHIYTYILPLCVLMAFGLKILVDFISNKFNKKSNLLRTALLSIIFVIPFLFSHTLFVDNTKEYPWEEKRLLFIKFKRKRRQSLFGFPYYRHWGKVGNYLQNTDNSGYFITNEKKSITRYYISPAFKNLEIHPYSGEKPGNVYVIYILHPQSANPKILDREKGYWQQKYQPVKTFFNKGRTVTLIYQLSASDWEREINIK
ncbi:MAG: glycosyltransferase family 39 protein [Rivularia sp. (in: Bacteria)]|nr:glycosyltransferase family 39 protein [Rivularia sp. MS3]